MSGVLKFGSVFPEAISKLQLVAWMPCLSSSDCSL